MSKKDSVVPLKNPGVCFVLICFLSVMFFISIPSAEVHGQSVDDTSQLDDEEAYETMVLFEQKKDPLFAGILSMYVPGLGQYYSGEMVKGTVFLMTEYTLLFGSLLYFLDFNFSAGGDSGFNMRIDAKRTDLGVVSTERKNVFFGMLSVLLFIHAYNITDAVQTAKDYNEWLEEEKFRIKKKYPEIEMSYRDDGGFFIGFTTHI
jgi:TM2 domain-containing membrane protein YozV